MYKLVSSKNEKIMTKLDSPSSILVVSIIIGALDLGLRFMSFFESAVMADVKSKKLCSQQHTTLIKVI